jgi:hypothetical protein
VTIIEGPEILSIRVRWLSHTKGAVMLGVLIPFFAVTIWTAKSKTPYIVLTLVLSYPALLLALNAYHIRIGGGTLTVSFGPIPIIRRRSIATADIREVSCTKTYMTAGRGTIERYALQVRTRDGPVGLLDTESENDTYAAVEAVRRWLDAHPSVRR